jgi:hypothetical protein
MVQPHDVPITAVTGPLMVAHAQRACSACRWLHDWVLPQRMAGDTISYNSLHMVPTTDVAPTACPAVIGQSAYLQILWQWLGQQLERLR